MASTDALRCAAIALVCACGRAAAPGARSSAFRDCPDCPEMIVIPAGTFTMGSSPAEQAWAVAHGATPASVADESPQHSVTIRSFALGKYHVTRGEYAAFVRATGHPAGDGCGHTRGKLLKQPELSWEHPGFDQTDRDPVVCVSWDDARAYVAWLNDKLHQQRYHLPTEAEWEYAARAKTTTYFWWGDDDAPAMSHAWFRANAGGHTHPVGGMPANPFGLYDIVGDAAQWTADCYAESHAGAPSDGTARAGDATCMRVDRGSSWFFPTWLLRSATRERYPPSYRDDILGFRVARSLE